MSNRRQPPPPPPLQQPKQYQQLQLKQLQQQQTRVVTSSSSTSPHTHNAHLQHINRDPLGILALSSSQVSSSSTLIDHSNMPFSNNNNNSNNNNINPTSPINIPAGSRRLHNNRNQSLGSASEFQSSPRSFGHDASISSSTGSPTNPFDGSPVEETASPIRPPAIRRATTTTIATTPSSLPVAITPSTRKAAKSSDYALSVVFSQFETIADKKMELILNMGVVSYL